ncbi:hypothetical protein [Aliikangiella sp. IMCC44359]|uniref:hypothetical protein n=1 Tax=Aliikangiella sp. IMCC44359 TaxID=3459125 RepID=UPI00403ADC05
MNRKPDKDKAKPIRPVRPASPEVKSLFAGRAVAARGGSTVEMRQAVHSIANNISHEKKQAISSAIRSHEYVTLERLQSEDHHNTVRKPDMARTGDTGAYGQSHAANNADGHFDKNTTRAIRAVDHTDNMTVNSGFVSLTSNLQGAQVSSDLKDSVGQASHIHTYIVPKSKAYNADDLKSMLRHQNTRTGGTMKQHLDSSGDRGYYGRFTWLNGTPTSEGEVLYEGDDLAKHHLAKRENPNAKK